MRLHHVLIVLNYSLYTHDGLCPKNNEILENSVMLNKN